MAIYSQFQTLDDICRHHAATRSDQQAIIFEGRSTSYRELDARASIVAAGLAAITAPQQRIAVMARNNDYFLELLMGASRSANVLVGVNWRLAAPEVAYVLEDSASRVLFVDGAFLPLVEAIRNQLPLLERVVVFDSGNDDDYVLWRDSQAEALTETRAGAEDIVMQLYTSGTTGRPKGVQLSHCALLSLREAEQQVGNWSHRDTSDVALVAMPLFHIGGTATALIALYNGARAIILAEVDPEKILQLIDTEGVTLTFLVPAVIQLLLDAPGCRPEVFSSLKLLFYGASPIPATLLQRALQTMDCDFAQIYGMTETAGSMTVLAPADHADPSAPCMASCGRPYPGVEISIADERGRLLPTGSIGEILIKSPSLMRGYWQRPKATSEALVDGWLHSGDAGYLDEDGFLYIYDRVKDMIVSGGENIYPAEVESALYGHPAVADVAVIGVPSERWGEAVKAVVMLADEAAVSEAALIDFARQHIAGYKAPKSVDFVSDLPRNASGKLLKKDIRAPYWQGMTRKVN